MKAKAAQTKAQREPTGKDFVPYRTDFLFISINRFSRNNPLYTGLLYFLISFVGLYLVGVLTGQFYGKNGIPPMYTQAVDNINLAFLAPVGAGLLCNLYNRICATITFFRKDGTISLDDSVEFDKLTVRLERLYNNKYVVAGAFLISLAINLFNHFDRLDSWTGINAGVTGIYARVVITLNYFMIALITYKCIVTVWAMQKALNYNIAIQPMHPDRAGGLKPIGRLSVAVNYFLAVIIIFFTLLMLFHQNARRQPLYIMIFVVFYISSPILLFLSLSKAYKKMAAKKKEALDRLGITFNYYYEKLTGNSEKMIYDIQSADEIAKVYRLYEIVEKMPVWPFDAKSITRFFTTITLPLIVFFIQLLVDTGSIIYNSDKIMGFFK